MRLDVYGRRLRIAVLGLRGKTWRLKGEVCRPRVEDWRLTARGHGLGVASCGLRASRDIPEIVFFNDYINLSLLICTSCLRADECGAPGRCQRN